MQDLNDLAYFVKVVEYGGFAQAERATGVPRSRLSRRVAALEERLGVRLIERSTRKFAVTTIGQGYFQHCKGMLIEAESAQELVDRNRSEPRGVVQLSCPTALLQFRVAPMLAKFMAECPGVVLELDATNRHIDVVEEHIDLALRVRFPPLEDSGLVMRRLAGSPQWLVASPEFIRTRAVATPDDLAGLPSMQWHLQGSDSAWVLTGPHGRNVVIPHQPRLVTDDQIALRAAAMQGIGVVQLPSMSIEDEVRSGTLVRVLPDWTPRAGIVHAVFASRRGMLPRVRRLIEFLATEFAAIDGSSRATGLPAQRA